jgi:hypothetical protein
MKKVTLIGDCHTARILEHWNPETCPVQFQAWGRGGSSAWFFEPEVWAENMEKSSSTETENVHGVDRRSLFLNFDEIKDQDLILVWLGYVDIRQYLGKYKDADFTAERMVERFVSYFKNTKIRFIEPLPQFTEMLMKHDELHDQFTYEERLEQNKQFVESLNKYCKKYNLEKPITQQQICNALGFEFKDFTPDKTPQNRPHPIDSLEQNYMSHVYDLIISEASK